MIDEYSVHATSLTDAASLTDAELLAETTHAAGAERMTTAALVALLAEVDARQLYLGLGFGSMFAYCMGVLRLSEPAPLGPASYLIKVTIGDRAHADLERARDLLRHVIPSGDTVQLIERALALLVADAERTKIATTARPRRATMPEATATRAHSTRHIPAAMRRAVWARDSGRCAFVGTHGRCSSTSWLEFHHVHPFADGGPTSVENLELRCRAHNQFEARQGEAQLAGGAIASGSRGGTTPSGRS